MIVKDSLQPNNSRKQAKLRGPLSDRSSEADSPTSRFEVEDEIFHMEDVGEGKSKGQSDEGDVACPVENIDRVKSAAIPSQIGKTHNVAVSGNDFSAATNEKTSNVSSIAGTKRLRTDEEPSVRVIYSSLTRSSKKKLEELLNCWSQWQAQSCASKDPSEEASEFGEETYFPALHIGGNSSSTVCFRMDNQPQKRQCKQSLSLVNDWVPTYDRDYFLELTPDWGSIDDVRPLVLREASRCFNCGSYNHSLRDCHKPRDNATVSNARKEYQSKKGKNTGPRVAVRYYQNSPCRKYDGLKPGSLTAETREALGIRELDPPPWLNRMRQLGYPPGYLADIEDEDQPSGLVIYGEEETSDSNTSNLKSSRPKMKMNVDFPGLNAPVPGNADNKSWDWDPFQGTSVDLKIFQGLCDTNRIYRSPDLTSIRAQNYIRARPSEYGHTPSLPISSTAVNPQTSTPSYSGEYKYVGAPTAEFCHNSTPSYSSQQLGAAPSWAGYERSGLHAGWPRYSQSGSSSTSSSPVPGSHMVQNLWHSPVLGRSFPGNN